MIEFEWPVVPISTPQKLDVRDEDILNCGMYRLCNCTRAGGGYDPFPRLVESRFGFSNYNIQFVVQLRGCVLNCPYCYVTKEGVWGKSVPIRTSDIISDFQSSGTKVFHLMGGSPALYIGRWGDIISKLKEFPDVVFHSDMLLMECDYSAKTLDEIFVGNSLYAINIKGTDPEEFLINTSTRLTSEMTSRFWNNLDVIVHADLQKHWYFTFTNCNENGVDRFLDMIKTRYPYELISLSLQEVVKIPIKQYKALGYEKV